MPKKRPEGIKLVAVIADTHCGSSRGLLPPSFYTSENNEVVPNSYQDWLWECYMRSFAFFKEVVGRDKVALVLNGDLIEGVHHGTKEIISPSVGDHVQAAIRTIEPFAEAAERIFVVRGTECHTNDSEAAVADYFGADMNPETRKRTFDRLLLDVNGVRHVFRHHIGTSVRRSSAGTQLSTQLAEEQIEAANNNEKIPKVLCVAHRHKFGKYEDENGLCVVSPPWQVLTRFAHKVVSQARTKPGIYILDHRGKESGQLPVVHAITFATPEQPTVAL
jgi:hypothetical protein